MTDVDVQYNAAERRNSGFISYIAPLPPIDTFFQSHSDESNDQLHCSDDAAIKLQIMTPEGAVFGFNEITGTVEWSKHLKSPIAGVWKYHCKSLVKLDLSDSELVPDLNYRFSKNDNSNGQDRNSETPKSAKRPSMYLGSFNNMWYVQVFQSPMEMPTIHTPNLSYNHNMVFAQSKAAWVPYLATSPSRTPYLNQEKSVIPLDQTSNEEFSTALMPINEEISYPYDAGFSMPIAQHELHSFSSAGFYFSSDRPSYFDNNMRHITDESGDRNINFYDDSFLPNTETILAFVPVSLSYYWRQIAAITVSLALFFNLVIQAYNHIRKKYKRGRYDSKPEKVKREQSSNDELNSSISRAASGFNEYFTFLEKLGKGGFGQVYVARHKLDLQKYAIKRIELPRNVDSADKMRREVRALSRLNHAHIVRYYNSWEETQTQGSGDFLAPFNSIDSYTDEISRAPDNKCAEKVSIGHLFNCRVNSGSVFESEKPQVCISSIGSKGDDSGNSESMTTTTNHNFMGSYMETSADDLIKFEASNAAEKRSVNRQNSKAQGTDCNEENKSGVLDKESENVGATPSVLSGEIESGSVSKPAHKQECLKSYLYIQMELCRPNTLKDWLMDEMERDRNISLHIFHQIIQAVLYVHAAGQFHRDLKPSNIFFSEKEALVKVGDFGLVTASLEFSDESFYSERYLELRKSSSNEINGLQKSNSNSGTSLKHTSRVGTKIYMSPEQRKGQPYDNKVDIYALGLILYELLQPFSTESERIARLKAARSFDFPSFEASDVNAVYTAEDIELVKKMLSVNPDDRPSAQELAEHEILKSYKVPSPATRLQKLSMSKSRSSSNMESNSSN